MLKRFLITGQTGCNRQWILHFHSQQCRMSRGWRMLTLLLLQMYKWLSCAAHSHRDGLCHRLFIFAKSGSARSGWIIEPFYSAAFVRYISSAFEFCPWDLPDSGHQENNKEKKTSMSVFQDLVLLVLSSPSTLLGTVALLLILCLCYGSFSSQKAENEPPGPRPFPLLGNLLQINLQRPYKTLCEVSSF